MQSENKFYCYSTNLNNYFNNNNLNPIDNIERFHPKTNQQYWIYNSGKEIDILLIQYKKNKPRL